MKENIARILVYLGGAVLIIGCVFLAYGYFQDDNLGDAIEVVIVGLVVFAGLIVLPILRKKKEERLKAQGLRLEADVVGVEKVINEDKKMEYIIVAKGKDIKTGQEIEFNSDTLNADPEKYLPSKITVLVDPQNSKDYVMDLDFLDKITPEEAEEEDLSAS